MKRNIITIDEDKCNGCGACVPDCPEGALQIIDGKVRLVGDLLCDGLGACVGRCPEDALSVELREAEPYDERKVIENVVKAGANTIKAHLEHMRDHNQDDDLAIAVQYLKDNGFDVPNIEKEKQQPMGCPGSMMRDMRDKKPEEAATSGPVSSGPSQLRQWPVQMSLVSPAAPFFKDADLLLSADCVPYAFSNFHERFLKDKVMITLCPKLDTTMDAYLEKLTAILRDNDIKSVTVLHMEVPCCTGIVRLLESALKASGKNILVKDYTISINGEII